MELQFQKALNEITKLYSGEIFLVKDLFKGYEWNRLQLNDRLLLGKLFYDRITKQYLETVIPIDKNGSNQQKYKKL